MFLSGKKSCNESSTLLAANKHSYSQNIHLGLSKNLRFSNINIFYFRSFPDYFSFFQFSILNKLSPLQLTLPPPRQSDCMAPLTSRSAPGSYPCTAACLNRRAQGFSGLSGQSKTSQMEPGIYWYRNRSPEGDCFTRQIFLHCVFPLCYLIKREGLNLFAKLFPQTGRGLFHSKEIHYSGGGGVHCMDGGLQAQPHPQNKYNIGSRVGVCVCVNVCNTYIQYRLAAGKLAPINSANITGHIILQLDRITVYHKATRRAKGKRPICI